MIFVEKIKKMAAHVVLNMYLQQAERPSVKE